MEYSKNILNQKKKLKLMCKLWKYKGGLCIYDNTQGKAKYFTLTILLSHKLSLKL